MKRLGLCAFALLILAMVLACIPLVHPDCIWQAEAQAWIDENGDGVWDSGELPLRNVVFNVDDLHNDLQGVAYALSDSSGKAELRIWQPGCPETQLEVYAEAPAGYEATTPERVADAGQKLFQFGYRYRAGAEPTPRPVAYLACTSYRVGQGGWSDYHMDVEAAPNGQVWAATNDGVRLFERPRDPQAGFITQDPLPDQFPHTLTIGPDGAVWLGTDRAAARFDGHAWTTYTTADGLADGPVDDIAVDAAGQVWFSTQHGISRFNPRTNQWLTNGIDYEVVRSWPAGAPIEATADGTLWLFPNNKAYELDPARQQSDSPLAAGDLRAVDALTAMTSIQGAAAGDGLLWVFGWVKNGPALARYDPASGRAVVYDHATTGGALYGASIADVAVAPDGSLWLALDDKEVAAVHFRPGSDPASGTWIEYGPANGLDLGTLRSVAVEAGGAVWFGTGDGTLARCTQQSTPPIGTPTPLPSKTPLPTQIPVVCAAVPPDAYPGWSAYTTADGLASNSVSAVAVAPDGAIWVGMAGGGAHGGASRFDGTAWKSWSEDDGLVSSSVSDIAIAPDGTVWFGTYDGGASRYDGRTWIGYSSGELAATLVSDVAVAPDGTIWFATILGASHYDGKRWTTYTTADGLPSANVHAVAAPDGAVWLGTAGTGVTRFDGKSWTHYTTADGLASDEVNAIAVSSGGALWFGTDAGVSRLEGGVWTTYTAADGLAGNKVFAVAAGPGGEVWLGTDGGASRFDDGTWTTFTTADGLLSERVVAIAVAADGAVWIGTGCGVSRYVPPEPAPAAAAGQVPSGGGGRIAFASGGATGYEIYVMNPDGSGVTRVPGADYAPAWSPDGARIAFNTYRGAGCRMSIYDVDADGSNPTLLVCSQAHVYGATWSPDGARIAYTGWGYRYWDIFIVNGDGSGETNLTGSLFKEASLEDYAAWSPDGTRIAFASVFPSGEPRRGWWLYVVNADGSGLAQISPGGSGSPDRPDCTETWKHAGLVAISPRGDHSPAWSPDGKRIAFVSDRDCNEEIYVMDADGSDVTRLTDHPAIDSHPAWSPDGTRIAFESDRDGTYDVFAMNADGSEVTNLTNSPSVEDVCPDWSPR